jgi:hypothetical protein
VQPFLGGPRAAIPLEVVTRSLASPSPRIRHGVTVLDGALNETGEELPLDLDAGGHVNWDYRPTDAGLGATAVTGVRRSAELSIAGEVTDEFIVGRLFRLEAETQDHITGTWVPWYLGVFTAHLPGKRWDGMVVRRTLELQPREHLWASRALDDWVTVASGTNPLDVVRTDLSDVFGVEDDEFPPTVDTLVEDMVFETGTSYLDKWTRLFSAVGLDQPITREDGQPTALVLSELDAREAEITYAPQGEVEDAGRIKRDGSIEPLDPSLPNVVRYVARRGPSLPEEGNGWATFRNEDTGPGSITSRGFEVFRSVDADASDQSQLEAFGVGDSQRLFAGGGRRFVGQVGWNPAHSDRDVVSFIRAGLGIDGGDWLVTSWSLPLRRVDGESAVVMPLTAEQRVVVTAV